MSSIQSALLSSPLPLSESTGHGPAAKPKQSAQDPEKVAKDFESVFASMILKEMRKSLEPGSMFGEDSSDVYGGLFDQHIGQHISESGGFGLAKMIRESLDKSMASAPDAVATPLNLD